MSVKKSIHTLTFRWFVSFWLMVGWLSVGTISFADHYSKNDDRFIFDAPHERFCIVKATQYDDRAEEMFRGVGCLVEHLTRPDVRLPQEWDVVPVVDIKPASYQQGPLDLDRDERISYVKSQLNSIVPFFPAGSVWVIGNEMDRPSIVVDGVKYNLQDDELPEDYAVIYHDLYEHIKSLDPSSAVVIGGIVQPTPLRMRYLDRVLSAYQETYGEPLKTDAWHVHNMVLNEVRTGHGAGIPPGISDNIGVQVPIDQNDNMERFELQIVDFRQWMANNGYRDTALVVYEYGILMPRELGYERDRVNAFMTATFDFFMSATDENTGYPADGNRLVQQWAWYSLNDYEYTFDDKRGFNGNLIEWDSGDLTLTGEVFLEYIAPDLHIDTAAVMSDGDNITVRANLQNLGISPIESASIQATLVANDGTTIEQTISVTNLLGGVHNAQEVDVIFENIDKTIEYELRLLSDPDNVLNEKGEGNNIYTAALQTSSVTLNGEITFDVDPIEFTVFMPVITAMSGVTAAMILTDLKNTSSN